MQFMLMVCQCQDICAKVPEYVQMYIHVDLPGMFLSVLGNEEILVYVCLDEFSCKRA